MGQNFLHAVVCWRRLSSSVTRVGGRPPPGGTRGWFCGQHCEAGQYGYVPLKRHVVKVVMRTWWTCHTYSNVHFYVTFLTRCMSVLLRFYETFIIAWIEIKSQHQRVTLTDICASCFADVSLL